MRRMFSSLVGVMGVALVAVAPGQSRAANLMPLVSFNGSDGASPMAGLISDAEGNLFGTTSQGGPHDGGSVFEIAKTVNGYASTPTTLVSFCSLSIPNGAGITVLCPRDRFAKQCYRGGAHCSLYGTSLCQAQQNIQLSINNIHRERRWSFKCCITESAASSDISLSAAFV